MSDDSPKRPAFQFYPGDEERDTSLRMLSLAAYGLWKRMINAMHFGQPYGHLTNASGHAVDPAQLGRLVGERTPAVSRLLRELESANVFSRNDSGVIYSRRMVRDEHIRSVRAQAGRLGGNPNLRAARGSAEGLDLLKQNPKQNQKQKPTPAVAVAVAVASALQSSPELPPADETPDVRLVIAHYLTAHPLRRSSAKMQRIVRKALSFGYSAVELCDAINGNAADGWHVEKRKHELSYVLRDQEKIDMFRALHSKPAPDLAIVDGWMSPELERATRPERSRS